MDAALHFLIQLKTNERVRGNLLGLLHLLIGRKLEAPDGLLIANGLTWRAVAGLLKKVRWDKTCIGQLGLSKRELPPRDREKMWYAAIALSGVDGDQARRAGDDLARYLETLGYRITPPPPPERAVPTVVPPIAQ